MRRIDRIMYQIVYTSSASPDFSANDLAQLLPSARLRNRDVGVTGMLVFHDGIFLQALEGESRAVNETFARIDGDRRHRDLIVLHRGHGPEQRVFGDWPMSFADFAGAAELLKGFVRVNEQLQLKYLDGSRAVELLIACGAEDALRSA
jgi:hypothetical protein